MRQRAIPARPYGAAAAAVTDPALMTAARGHSYDRTVNDLQVAASATLAAAGGGGGGRDEGTSLRTQGKKQRRENKTAGDGWEDDEDDESGWGGEWKSDPEEDEDDEEDGWSGDSGDGRIWQILNTRSSTCSFNPRFVSFMGTSEATRQIIYMQFKPTFFHLNGL
jgi:hypothetical protein